MPATTQPYPHWRALLLIPIAVLLTIHPLLIHGPSCGQDLGFHIQSWLDAASQLRQGHYPHWDTTAAWNAGEPRFLFYPPLSWLLGAILTLIFPISLCPTLFIAIAFFASGLTFYKLASEFASPNAALIASTLYLANPYMLFTAFERSALAELLAAAWIPLLLLAALSRRPTIRGIAIPLALLWLTNAPAAVIGSYALALIATLRVLQTLIASPRLSSRPEPDPELVEGAGAVERSQHSTQRATPSQASAKIQYPKSLAPATIRYPEPLGSGLIGSQKEGGFSPWGKLFRTAPESPLRLALTYLAGTLLGLTLPAFYLLPAAYERRFIQVAMAIIPNLRYQDNFLFTHTADAAHNAVNHTISTLALTLLIVTTLLVLTFFATRKKPAILTLSSPKGQRSRRACPEGSRRNPEELHATNTASSFSTTTPKPASLAPTVALLTLTIALLLTPFSTPIWQHLPNLAYIQFPWRLLILLTPILALTIALLLDTRSNLGAPCLASETWVRRVPSSLVTALTLILPLTLSAISYRLYHQSFDPTNNPATLSQLFTTHHGFPPTDEYTPTQADNDPLRTTNPAYWLAHAPNDPAPNTLPTAAELNPNVNTDDTPIPPNQTLSTHAPHHLTLTLIQPSLLVLNLRDYPNWQLTNTHENSLNMDHPRHIARNDGLIAISIPAGQSTIDITWHRTLDEQLGLALSAFSLMAVALTYRRNT
jgi:hypothetical protein